MKMECPFEGAESRRGMGPNPTARAHHDQIQRIRWRERSQPDSGGNNNIAPSVVMISTMRLKREADGQQCWPGDRRCGHVMCVIWRLSFLDVNNPRPTMIQRSSFVCARCTYFSRARHTLSRHRFQSQSRRNASQTVRNRPFRVAIVGSGPAGFYAAYRLLGKIEDAVVDMYEKLPVPFGLVRYGVAPDHPEVKVCAPVHDRQN